MDVYGKEQVCVFYSILYNIYLTKTEVDFDLVNSKVEIRLWNGRSKHDDYFTYIVSISSEKVEWFFRTSMTRSIDEQDRKAFAEGNHFAVMIDNRPEHVVLVADGNKK